MARTKLLINPPDVEATATLVDELAFIRKHKVVLKALLEFEGECHYPMSLNDLELTELGAIDIRRSRLPVENAFEMQSDCTSYEADNFNHTLLNSDYANYMEAIRRQYAEGKDFGETHEWVVFSVIGTTKVRVRARGCLSRLQTTYMDAVTAQIAKDAGVTISRATILFIVKANLYEAVRHAVLSA